MEEYSDEFISLHKSDFAWFLGRIGEVDVSFIAAGETIECLFFVDVAVEDSSNIFLCTAVRSSQSRETISLVE